MTFRECLAPPTGNTFSLNKIIKHCWLCCEFILWYFTIILYAVDLLISYSKRRKIQELAEIDYRWFSLLIRWHLIPTSSLISKPIPESHPTITFLVEYWLNIAKFFCNVTHYFRIDFKHSLGSIVDSKMQSKTRRRSCHYSLKIQFVLKKQG